jgi:hypothetical protein
MFYSRAPLQLSRKQNGEDFQKDIHTYVYHNFDGIAIGNHTDICLCILYLQDVYVDVHLP